MPSSLIFTGPVASGLLLDETPHSFGMEEWVFIYYKLIELLACFQCLVSGPCHGPVHTRGALHHSGSTPEGGPTANRTRHQQCHETQQGLRSPAARKLQGLKWSPCMESLCFEIGCGMWMRKILLHLSLGEKKCTPSVAYMLVTDRNMQSVRLVDILARSAGLPYYGLVNW